MKTINTYINEKLHITSKQQYTCQPKTWDELHEIIIQRIEEDGNDCDLNDIDVSKINDMSYLFCAGDNKIFKNFNGDISRWDVSNVINMGCMFYECEKFNCDISRWDVSHVKNMTGMFYYCGQFNCDLSDWDVSNVNNMKEMFFYCNKFNSDIIKWNVSNVTNMNSMFYECENFRQNLDEWDVSNVKTMNLTFEYCPTKPKWYKE